jgi:hypothetical protein
MGFCRKFNLRLDWSQIKRILTDKGYTIVTTRAILTRELGLTSDYIRSTFGSSLINRNLAYKSEVDYLDLVARIKIWYNEVTEGKYPKDYTKMFDFPVAMSDRYSIEIDESWENYEKRIKEKKTIHQYFAVNIIDDIINEKFKTILE